MVGLSALCSPIGKARANKAQIHARGAFMAIAINFDKNKAKHFIDALAAGKSITGVQTVDDILALAGACFFMAMSQGPALQQAVDWSKVGSEQQGSRDEDTFISDIHAAIEYYAQLTLLVADGEYDEDFEPRHRAIVMLDEGNKTVIPIEGMREDAMS
jgi:hypothetical protein